MFNTTKERNECLKRIRDAKIVEPLIEVAQLMKVKKIKIVINLLAKLFNSSEIEEEMCRQFFAARGLHLIKKLDLFNAEGEVNLVDVLSIICQFCRISEKYYRSIDELAIYEDLSRCFKHPDAGIDCLINTIAVRAKACNMIGHMCRHSDFFYPKLIQFGIIDNCIECCRDTDTYTRKFACFALGNAAFHNDKLYQYLKPAIPLIINLLRDTEERTRANASGALGNFARNSSILVKDLLQAGAVPLLLDIATNDTSLVTPSSSNT